MILPNVAVLLGLSYNAIAAWCLTLFLANLSLRTSSPPSPPLDDDNAPENFKMMKAKRTKLEEREWGKSLRTLFEEMGAFEHQDEMKLKKELLAMCDERRPLRFGRDNPPHNAKAELNLLFERLMETAKKESSWIRPSDLGSMFRFAMRRPLMPEKNFATKLYQINPSIFNVWYDGADPGLDQLRLRNTALLGVEDNGSRHVSSKLRHLTNSPSLSEEKISQPRESSTESTAKRDEGLKPKYLEDFRVDALELRRKLWNVYDDVEDGVIDLADAPLEYNRIRMEETPERYCVDQRVRAGVSNRELANYLYEWGLPACHIPLPDLKAFRKDVRNWRHRIFDDDGYRDISVPQRIGIRSIANCIRLHRDSGVLEHTAPTVEKICQCLEELRVDTEEVEMLMNFTDMTPFAAAHMIWDSAKSSPPPEDGPVQNIRQRKINGSGRKLSLSLPQLDGTKGTLGSISGNVESDGSLKNPRRSGSSPGLENILPSVENMDGEELSAQRSIQVKAPADYSSSSVRCRGPTPILRDLDKAASLVTASGQLEKISRSPDDGMTKDLFGIQMPIEQARRIAHCMNLPKSIVIRSDTPQRTSAEATSNVGKRFTFCSPKRKASVSFEGSSPKMSRQSSPSRLFAREGEDSETFLRRCVHEDSRERNEGEALQQSRDDHSQLAASPKVVRFVETSSDEKVQNDRARELAPPDTNDAFFNKVEDSGLEEKIQAPRMSVCAFLATISGAANVMETLRGMQTSAQKDPEAVSRACVKLDQISEAIVEGKVESMSSDDDAVLNFLDRIIHSKRETTSHMTFDETKSSGEACKPSNANGQRRESPENSVLISSASNQSNEPYRRPGIKTKCQAGTKISTFGQSTRDTHGSPYADDKRVISDNSAAIALSTAWQLDLLPGESMPLTGPKQETQISGLKDPGEGEMRPFDINDQKSSSCGPARPKNSIAQVSDSRKTKLRVRLPNPRHPSNWSEPKKIIKGEADGGWAMMSFELALQEAEEKALEARMHLPCYMQCRRRIRAKIKKRNALANKSPCVDSYFSGTNVSSTSSSSISAIQKLFDKYRGQSHHRSTELQVDNTADDPTNEPDRIGVEGSMKYLQELGVKLDEPVLLVILTELKAPTMGEFTRDGFVDGWSNMRYTTPALCRYRNVH